MTDENFYKARWSALVREANSLDPFNADDRSRLTEIGFEMKDIADVIGFDFRAWLEEGARRYSPRSDA